MKNIYIIGVGLIGGSLALDIKSKNPDVKIFGIDSEENHLKEAQNLNIIDEPATYKDLPEADLVILAIPVDAAITQLPKVLDAVSDSAVVIDVGSTKLPICKVVENHPKRRNFLATHPIAGTEFSGPKAAILNLFKDKANIICEVEKTAFRLQEKVLKLFGELGMRIRYM
ncbi:MAG TPA: prephenate dehydrogenase/arogenate dehydrogenase family protein, partial [Salinimicrobium sp.]|nr:prephenate dehydrogenase/arogenate dehydrogenase family protein [Salinimicrobium sp.]